MTLQLSNDDRCAVDLLLDRESGLPGELNSCFSLGATNLLQARIARVEMLLHALDQYRVEDPAADLASRTLDRCDRAAQARATHAQPAQPLIGSRPQA